MTETGDVPNAEYRVGQTVFSETVNNPESALASVDH
jgi:hypothetical protein